MHLRLTDLRTRFAQHNPYDAEETGHLQRMQELAADPAADPCARAHFAPGHFTASAFVLSPEQDALLLIFHGKLARWLQPGGHIDETDRDVLAAARREVEEEVGISSLELVSPAPFDLDIHAIPAMRGEPAHAHFDVRFLFRAKDRSFRAGSDAKAARWVPLDEVSLDTSDRSVMRAVEKLQAGAFARLEQP